MKKMHVYVAIGHFKDEANCMRIIAFADTTKANFYKNCQGNAFAACAVLTKKQVNNIINATDIFERWEMIKKLTNNYRKWNELDDLFEQCADLFIEKIEKAKAEC